MTRTTRIAVLTLAVLALLAACAKNPGGAMNSASPSATDPVVSLVRTGGIAGIADKVTIARDGSWTATDRAGTQRTGQLTEQQRESLRSLAADPRLREESKRTQGPSRCADIYQYTLTVDEVRISFLDCPTDEDLPVAAKAVIALVTGSVWG
jgi:hypothetical protein